MKNYCPICRIAAGLFFFLFFSINLIHAQPKAPDPPAGYDTVTIVKTNWLNTMGCTYDTLPCVEMDADNKLVFLFRTRMGTNKIDSFPPAHIQYYVISEVPGGTKLDGQLTGPITNDMIESVVLENGISAYEAVISVEINLESDCVVEDEYGVDIGYLLVEGAVGPVPGVVGPYPVGDHPDLFPPAVFKIHPSGEAQSRERSKDMCCYDPLKPPSCLSLAPVIDNPKENKRITSRNALDGNANDLIKAAIAVFPNPFRSAMQAQYRMQAAGEMTISCIDAQGRLISQHQRQHDAAGSYQLSVPTDSWAPGVYYLRFETAGATETLKVVRLAE